MKLEQYKKDKIIEMRKRGEKRRDIARAVRVPVDKVNEVIDNMKDAA